MGSVEEEQRSPLVGSFSSSDHETEKPFERTGTIFTALAHIITGVIGAGVLSLAWSMAQLGWIAGPICMIAFASVTIFSSSLLCDCYRFPDPEVGPNRTRSYMQAVKLYLGDKSEKVCGILVQESLYGSGVTYTFTTANCLRLHTFTKFHRLL